MENPSNTEGSSHINIELFITPEALTSLVYEIDNKKPIDPMLRFDPFDPVVRDSLLKLASNSDFQVTLGAMLEILKMKIWENQVVPQSVTLPDPCSLSSEGVKLDDNLKNLRKVLKSNYVQIKPGIKFQHQPPVIYLTSVLLSLIISKTGTKGEKITLLDIYKFYQALSDTSNKKNKKFLNENLDKLSALYDTLTPNNVHSVNLFLQDLISKAFNNNVTSEGFNNVIVNLHTNLSLYFLRRQRRQRK